MERIHKKKGKEKPKQHMLPTWKKELDEMNNISAQYEQVESSGVSTFADIPLSTRTRRGLEEADFREPTVIQKEGIILGLKGRDVLGAAKTGSGKTLAFLVPVLEKLWRERWSSLDGLGALLISPTRELAYQTFEVLRKVGKYHDFSGGLVIGGKDLKIEQDHILNTNIVVCTPGRLLQHMDETPNFDCANLKVLVLDEADRILDLGFKTAMNAIIENLPDERQTLLYSATQTKSVQDLARLSLREPSYISTYESSATVTPQRLTQSYIVCELPQKLNILYSFIRNHTKYKIIVFFSSCKQVKFTYETFCRLRPGVPLMALYGKQKQLRRVAIYNDFCKRDFAVLLCTDIAARGLDFPAVHWVVQVDCPEDANTYIHRAGRTARFEKDGQALLFLLPSEENKFVEQLQAKKVPINKIQINPKKLRSIQGKLEAFCAQDGEMKHWAQKSFISYMRSVYLQSNKDVFNVRLLPASEYATSLGLVQPPKIRFMKKLKHKVDQDSDAAENFEVDSESDHDESVTPSMSFNPPPTQEQDQEFLTVKRTITSENHSDDSSTETTLRLQKKRKSTTRVSQAKKLVNKKLKLNTHIIFDDGDKDNDENSDQEEKQVESDTEEGGIDVDEAKELIKIQDKADQKQERERIKEMHKMRRLKTKVKRQPKQKSAGATLDQVSEEPVLSPPTEVDEDDYIEDDEEMVLHLLRQK